MTQEKLVVKITKVEITVIKAMKADNVIMVIEQKSVETTKTTETNKVPVFVQAITLFSIVSIALRAIDILFDISIF